MYASADARQLAVLLRISRTMDIVGDVSVTVDNPSELLAWANILKEPTVLAWRAGCLRQAVRAGCRASIGTLLSTGTWSPSCAAMTILEFFRLLLDGSELESGR